MKQFTAILDKNGKREKTVTTNITRESIPFLFFFFVINKMHLSLKFQATKQYSKFISTKCQSIKIQLHIKKPQPYIYYILKKQINQNIKKNKKPPTCENRKITK